MAFYERISLNYAIRKFPETKSDIFIPEVAVYFISNHKLKLISTLCITNGFLGTHNIIKYANKIQ